MSRARQKPTILGVCKHVLKETQTSNSKTKCRRVNYVITFQNYSGCTNM